MVGSAFSMVVLPVSRKQAPVVFFDPEFPPESRYG
jgi:hypothetical protein